MTVLARDRPGELIKILKPLSDINANIHGVFHDHEIDEDKKGGSVPVEIVFNLDPNLSETDVKQRLESIKKSLEESDLTVLHMAMVSSTKKKHVIFLGHIFDTDIRDSILQINSTGAKIVDIKATILNPDRESTVMFTITHDSSDVASAIDAKVASICAQKGLKYITS